MSQSDIAAVVAAAEKVEGRVKLQKIVYLLQRTGFDLGYRDFTLLLHGPYSDSLAADLDRVTGTMLAETREKTKMVFKATREPVMRYVYKPRNKEVEEALLDVLREKFRDRTDLLLESIARLNGQDSPLLELVATAIYIRDEMRLRDPDALWGSVLRLKGHLKRYLRRAKLLLGEWDSEGVFERSSG